jgi:hypothetical protein
LEGTLTDRVQEVWSFFSSKHTLDFALSLFWSRSNVLNFFKSNVEIFSNKGVKPVFDFVLRSSWKLFAYFRPFASNFAVKLKDFLILLFGPFFLFDSRIQLVDKPLSDLLSIFGSQHF